MRIQSSKRHANTQQYQLKDVFRRDVFAYVIVTIEATETFWCRWQEMKSAVIRGVQKRRPRNADGVDSVKDAEYW